MIVLGSAVSLAYYLRVVAAMWMRPRRAPPRRRSLAGGRRARLAGGVAASSSRRGARRRRRAGRRAAPPSDARVGRPTARSSFVAVVFGVATLAAGIVPGPLFDLVRDAGASFRGLL